MVRSHYFRVFIWVVGFAGIINPIVAAIGSGDNYSGLNPQYLKIKVYKLAVSSDPYCQNPVVIFDNPSPTPMNMMDAPNLGNGDLLGGTYQCMMVEISDTVAFASNTSAGGCTRGQENRSDICSDLGTSFQRIGALSSQACSNAEHRIGLFFSTASTNESHMFTGNGFMPPTVDNANLGYKQNAALVVNRAIRLRLVANGNARIDDRNGACAMQLPLFELKTLE
jgi:hypothetical protein